jgi:hypothetical protein
MSYNVVVHKNDARKGYPFFPRASARMLVGVIGSLRMSAQSDRLETSTPNSLGNKSGHEASISLRHDEQVIAYQTCYANGTHRVMELAYVVSERIALRDS